MPNYRRHITRKQVERARDAYYALQGEPGTTGDEYWLIEGKIHACVDLLAGKFAEDVE